MELKDSSLYPVREVTAYVPMSERSLQMYAKKNNFRKIDNRYMFTGHDIKELVLKRNKTKPKKNISLRNVSVKILELIEEINNNDYVISLLNAIKEEKHLEAMSQEEYLMFVDKLKEANHLAIRVEEYKQEIERMEGYVLDYRNNIEYFKKSLDKRQEETEILLNTINQRNYIEVKEKGLDGD